MPSQQQVLDAIRATARELGRPPSRAEFIARTRITEYQYTRHFASWLEAVRAAGLDKDPGNIRLDDETLLKDWAEVVRKGREVPTILRYGREGKYSPSTFERAFGPWSMIPKKFRTFANGSSEWADVLALLPPETTPRERTTTGLQLGENEAALDGSNGLSPGRRHVRLDARPTYGNPMDFRGLRHEPVNEQGVVFLFGMVARELGYSVEAVQTGFPDCEAKRQIEKGKWQRVRIEFEFESRTFRDHGHPPEGCDVIVCWRHNWSDCPPNLEVIALADVIGSLSKSQD